MSQIDFITDFHEKIEKKIDIWMDFVDFVASASTRARLAIAMRGGTGVGARVLGAGGAGGEGGGGVGGGGKAVCATRRRRRGFICNQEAPRLREGGSRPAHIQTSDK